MRDPGQALTPFILIKIFSAELLQGTACRTEVKLWITVSSSSLLSSRPLPTSHSEDLTEYVITAGIK
jgi:hypothetical protein